MLSSAALYKKDKRRIDPAKLESMIGEEVGISDWAILDQQKIDAFAELTLDPYFIHTDPARAKAETPFGGTIAHGFLTLSMLSAMDSKSAAQVRSTISFRSSRPRLATPMCWRDGTPKEYSFLPRPWRCLAPTSSLMGKPGRAPI